MSMMCACLCVLANLHRGEAHHTQDEHTLPHVALVQLLSPHMGLDLECHVCAWSECVLLDVIILHICRAVMLHPSKLIYDQERPVNITLWKHNITERFPLTIDKFVHEWYCPN